MSEKWAVFEDPIEYRGYTSVQNVVLRSEEISLAAKALYAILKSFAWQDDHCFPGMELLARYGGCDEKTIRKYRKELETSGLIEVQRRGQGRPNLYVFKALSSGQDTNTCPDQEQDMVPDEEDSPKKDSVKNTPPSDTLYPQSGEPGAPQLIEKLAEELEDADIPLMKRQKTIYGKQFKEALNKGTPYGVLEKAADRIIERWQSAKHAKLTVDMALGDVATGKAAKQRNGSPREAIEEVKSRADLGRYASIMETYDFSGEDLKPEAVPINILKQLGGDFIEQSRNLARIMSISARSRR